MSFKRDGDDSSWLNLLKKRRVEELLAVDVPSNEALLTSNGRFACLVCHNRPVFDNVQMLAIHRNGKKHLAAQDDFNEKKPQNSQGRRPNAIAKRPNYDHRIHGKNPRKRSAPTSDELDRAIEELEELSRDDEDHLIKLKPYKSKCQFSSTYIPRQSDAIKCPVMVDPPSLPKIQEVPLPKAQISSIRSETKVGASGSGSGAVETSDNQSLSRWTTEQKELYIKSLQAGWKRTPAGEWVKDQEAEFDSDDDEPPRLQW